LLVLPACGPAILEVTVAGALAYPVSAQSHMIDPHQISAKPPGIYPDDPHRLGPRRDAKARTAR
jgi:hypothetical protein